MRNQDHVQDKGSKCQIEDQNIQTRKEKHSGLYDQVQHVSYEGRYR